MISDFPDHTKKIKNKNKTLQVDKQKMNHKKIETLMCYFLSQMKILPVYR